MKTIIKTLDAGKLEIHLKYLFEDGINLRDRIITLNEDINHSMFKLVDAAMSELEASSRKTIIIRINSSGGNVNDAMAIVGRIQTSPCHVVTEGYGAVMSAATLILASGNKRRLSKFSQFMWHEIGYEVEGTHTAIKNEVQEMERLWGLWSRMMASFTDVEEAYWNVISDGQDKYFTPEQALELNIVDELI